MRISDFIAQTITQRRALVWSGVAVLTIGCIAILVISLRLDSEVFNVLPGSFPSVQGLKIYDRDFEQTRQLTFALLCNPKDVDKLEEFAPLFAERLRQQPWCSRLLAGSPMSTADGIRDLQSTGTAPHLARPHHAHLSGSNEPSHRQRFRLPAFDAARK